MTRTFSDKPAERGPTPLLFGIIGPSGSGKTYSALRLATGMQRVTGGEIFVVDTESNRALHYADRFKFRHVPFTAPFSPLDYLAAIEHCVSRGAKIVVVDSMSHEHEGVGGVLEWHAAETERLMEAWHVGAEKAQIPAWAKPKAARRKLLNALIQMPVHFIFCFRAKEKVRIGRGEVVQLGFMPIAGEEFVYEATAKALLLPGASGVPTWQPEHAGERLMAKLPEQFRQIFSGAAGRPLDEDIGEQLARWASGTEAAQEDGLVAAYDACDAPDMLDELEAQRRAVWPELSPAEKRAVKAASQRAQARVTL